MVAVFPVVKVTAYTPYCDYARFTRAPFYSNNRGEQTFHNVGVT